MNKGINKDYQSKQWMKNQRWLQWRRFWYSLHILLFWKRFLGLQKAVRKFNPRLPFTICCSRHFRYFFFCCIAARPFIFPFPPKCSERAKMFERSQCLKRRSDSFDFLLNLFLFSFNYSECTPRHFFLRCYCCVEETIDARQQYGRISFEG